MYVCVCVCVCVRACVRVCVRMHVCMYVCMYVGVWVCVWVCTHGRAKTAYRNDLNLCIIVILDTVSKPIDFRFVQKSRVRVRVRVRVSALICISRECTSLPCSSFIYFVHSSEYIQEG